MFSSFEKIVKIKKPLKTIVKSNLKKKSEKQENKSENLRIPKSMSAI